MKNIEKGSKYKRKGGKGTKKKTTLDKEIMFEKTESKKGRPRRTKDETKNKRGLKGREMAKKKLKKERKVEEREEKKGKERKNGKRRGGNMKSTCVW